MAVFYILLCILFLLSMLVLPEQVILYASNGLKMFASKVFPSLFPFLVAASLLRGLGIIKRTEKIFNPVMKPLFNMPGSTAFVFLTGIISGFPAGAVETVKIYEKGLITKKQAERLLIFSNNASPVFITGTVCTAILSIPFLGFRLLAINIFSAVVTGFIFKYIHKDINYERDIEKTCYTPFKKPLNTYVSFSSILGPSIEQAVNVLLIICGYITLFSVVTGILEYTGIYSFFIVFFSKLFSKNNVFFNAAPSLLSGFFEITSGIIKLPDIHNSFFNIKFAAAGFITGWSGICVHFQVASIVKKYGLNLKPYFIGKFIQGILCALFCLISLSIWPVDVNVFSHLNSFNLFNVNPGYYMTMLLICIIIVLISIRDHYVKN